MSDDPRAQERVNRLSEQERNRTFAQRWATPGDDPFEQWFWTMFRYFNRKIDPEILAIYRKMLGHIPIPELEAVFEQYIMQDDISAREPPKVYVLYAMWKKRKGVQEERRAKKRNANQKELPNTAPRDDLRKLMFPMICGEIIGPNQYFKFEGDAPEWMRTIATWAGQQFRSKYPGLEFYELTEREQQGVFDAGLELFDAERSQHEEQSQGTSPNSGDPVREP